MSGTLVARWLAALLLGGSAIAEVWMAPSEWAAAVTPLQHAVVVGQTGMILAGLAGGAGVLLRRPWAARLAAVWAGSAVLAGSLAPRAYGGAPWSVSAVAALLCAAIGLAAVLLTRAGVRAPLRPAEAPR